MLNYKLLDSVRKGFNKQAFVPGDPTGGMPPADPSAMGGMPPVDPAMSGGMPPADPSMMGGMPPVDPAMAGGMPPADPSMMGGMPPVDPAMIGMIGGAAPQQPAPAAAPMITCSLDDLAKFMQKVLQIKNGGTVDSVQSSVPSDMQEIRQSLAQIAAQMGSGQVIG